MFNGKAGCGQCHSGPNLTEEFHNTGVAWRTGVLTDQGRAGVTSAAVDRGAFKTPTLREISRTAPYMHDGSLMSLPQVIEYYDTGGAKMGTKDRGPGTDKGPKDGLSTKHQELRTTPCALDGFGDHAHHLIDRRRSCQEGDPVTRT